MHICGHLFFWVAGLEPASGRLRARNVYPALEKVFYSALHTLTGPTSASIRRTPTARTLATARNAPNAPKFRELGGGGWVRPAGWPGRTSPVGRSKPRTSPNLWKQKKTVNWHCIYGVLSHLDAFGHLFRKSKYHEIRCPG